MMGISFAGLAAAIIYYKKLQDKRLLESKLDTINHIEVVNGEVDDDEI